MVFCNKGDCLAIYDTDTCHNPYFNRWFSAIKNKSVMPVQSITGHNPYFNRWFSAILLVKKKTVRLKSHNPYFNRWFSAIRSTSEEGLPFVNVTILILIDGFLQ